MNHSNLRWFHVQSSASFPDLLHSVSSKTTYRFSRGNFKVLDGFMMRWEEQKLRTSEYSSHSFHTEQEFLWTKQHLVLETGAWAVSLFSKTHNWGIKHQLFYRYCELGNALLTLLDKPDMNRWINRWSATKSWYQINKFIKNIDGNKAVEHRIFAFVRTMNPWHFKQIHSVQANRLSPLRPQCFVQRLGWSCFSFSWRSDRRGWPRSYSIPSAPHCSIFKVILAEWKSRTDTSDVEFFWFNDFSVTKSTNNLHVYCSEITKSV